MYDKLFVFNTMQKQTLKKVLLVGGALSVVQNVTPNYGGIITVNRSARRTAVISAKQ